MWSEQEILIMQKHFLSTEKHIDVEEKSDTQQLTDAHAM